MISFDEAQTIAEVLKKKSPRIHGIDLFGSIVHNGHGRDADLAVLTDEEIARQWWHEERNEIRVRWPDALYSLRWLVKLFAPFLYATAIEKRKHRRLDRAWRILDIDVVTFPLNLDDVELFLMPVNWREGKEVNQATVEQITGLWADKNTRGFLKRIAGDAVRIA